MLDHQSFHHGLLAGGVAGAGGSAPTSQLSHMLCSPDCAASLALARTRMAAATEIDPDAPPRIAAHLATPVLRLDYRQAALVTGAWQGERFVVRTFQPFASADFGVAPQAVRALRPYGGRIVLELDDGREQIVAARAPVLVEPDRPLAAPIARVLEEAMRQPRADRTVDNGRGPIDVANIAALLAPSTAVGDHEVAGAELDRDGGLRVTLSNGTESLDVLIRPWDPTRSALSRRGPWSLDLADGHQPSEPERRAIGALAMLLPAGNHSQGK